MILQRHTRKLGFTLVELIVVIAILGILAAVSMPFIFSRMAKADLASCTEQIKQISLIGQKYSQDMAHRNMLPASGMDDNEDTENIDESEAWWLSIAPRMKDVVLPKKLGDKMKVSEIFHCPGDKRVDIGEGGSFLADEKTVSYVSWSDGSVDSSNPDSGIRMNKQRLSELPWISDGVPVKGRSVTSKKAFEQMVLPALERHDFSIAVAYADGRIASVKLDPEGETLDQMYKKVAPWLVENPVEGAEAGSRRSRSSRR